MCLWVRDERRRAYGNHVSLVKTDSVCRQWLPKHRGNASGFFISRTAGGVGQCLFDGDIVLSFFPWVPAVMTAVIALSIVCCCGRPNNDCGFSLPRSLPLLRAQLLSVCVSDPKKRTGFLPKTRCGHERRRERERETMITMVHTRRQKIVCQARRIPSSCHFCSRNYNA